jgi:general secretion pathway protein H
MPARFRKDDGFSLVELMVVMAIIGLMAGAVVLVMPRDDVRLERSLDHTRSYMTALARTAIASGRIVGLRLTPEGYRPLMLEDGKWQENPGVIGKGEDWGNLIAGPLTLDGAAVKIEAGIGRPQVWFLPTGEVAAFELALALDGRMGKLKSLGNGCFEVAYDG